MSQNSLELQFSDYSAAQKSDVVQKRNQAVFVLGMLVKAGMTPVAAKEAVEVLWNNAFQEGQYDGVDL